jgi:L-2-hydroxycarboxylate dehydrogenase (NAD+)
MSIDAANRNTQTSLRDLRETTLRALRQLGLDEHERQTVTDVLLYAQIRGNSQGLIKIVERTILPDSAKQATEALHKSPCLASINGHGNIGMVVLLEAAKLAAEMVQRSGIALVTTHNTRSSTGAIGYYASTIARAGHIGLILAGSPKVMAVEGGIDPVMGTNPVAIGIPTGNEPLVLDMATAAIAWFSVIDARNRGESLPPGVAVDQHGQPTTDPLAALGGALKTFGGAKGAGLALMFEILTGPLTGASIVGENIDNRGNVVIAINPDMITDRDTFTERVDAMLDFIRNGRNTVRLPGEHSAATAARCLLDDRVSIDSELLKDLQALATGD